MYMQKKLKNMSCSRFLIYSFLGIGLFSCSYNTPEYRIRIDYSKSVDYSISSETDFLDGIQGEIRHTEILEDGNAVILAGQHLYLYDFQSDSVLLRYSNRGRKMDEYISISDFWIERDGGISLYDMESRKILTFHEFNGVPPKIRTLYASQGHVFDELAPLTDSTYVGKCTYGVGAIPELCLYDKEYSAISPIGDNFLNSGMKASYPFAPIDNGVLYCGCFSYDIYQISEESCLKKYQIDFVKGSIHHKRYNSEYEIMQALNRTMKNKVVITSIGNMYENDESLSFRYIDNSFEAYLAIYDKSTSSVHSVHLIPPEDCRVQQINITETYLYVWMMGRNGGVMVYRTSEI